MTDVNTLFANAERAFFAGRVEEARNAALSVRRVVGDHPRVLHLLAMAEARRGDAAAARTAYQAALRKAPNDPIIHGSFAGFLADQGEIDTALKHHGRAVALAPQKYDFRYNRALLLYKIGRPDEALADLDKAAAGQPNDGKIHSARGSALRTLGRFRDAAAAYDRALALDPKRLPALLGRATVAKERGEENAPAFYRRALSTQPNHPDLILGLAESMEVTGEPGAIDVLARAVAAQPQWVQGQTVLARMRWEANEGADVFARDLENAVAATPSNRELWAAWAATLGAADLSAESADVAARARAALKTDDVGLMLIEAVRASEAGQVDRADRLFAAAPRGAPGLARMEMRHRVRLGQYDEAERLGAAARDETPWDVATWAMTGMLWRLTDDPRAEWLVGQPGLVDAMSLELEPAELATIAERLRKLHTTEVHPLGQSLRGGTQTRGLLFERDEPEIIRLRAAIEQAVNAFWDRLPPEDATHPLLRLRRQRPRIAGSWSVRLTDGGFHIGHYHPRGALSSASYLVVPEARAPTEGWLEIGGMPGGLDVPIEPFRLIEPKPGRMALFPSYFFHGTRPFAAGERLTVAFDVVA